MSSETWMLDPGFTTPALSDAFSVDNRLQRMLDVEAALAQAEAAVELIPEESAAAIAAACRTSGFDAPAIFAAGWEAGSPVIPMVEELRRRVGPEHAEHVHVGATSQDIIDTALVLQIRRGLEILLAGLEAVGGHCARLADQHRRTAMVGRTLLQQAAPITFGFKVAQWLDPVVRHLRRVEGLRGETTLQLGGPVGTLDALGGRALQVVDLLASELDLQAPAIPWHTARDRLVDLASTLVGISGTMAKIAGDVALLAQNEVAEVASRPGGSSSMPHKRNPIDAGRALAAARLTQGAASVLFGGMQHEQERAVGAWQAEWAAVPIAFQAAGAAVEAVTRLLDTLEVRPEAMRDNLERSGLADRGLGATEQLIDQVLAEFEQVVGG